MKTPTLIIWSVLFSLLNQAYCIDPIVPCNMTVDCHSEYLDCDLEFHCVHKAVFPVLGTEAGGIVILILLKMCLAIAGIGGGSLVVALAMALFGFTTKPAIALSSFATFISTLGAFFVNFRLRHPEKP